MLHSKRYPGLYIKEEGANPTGTFKARGLGLAVTMAKHYGLQHLAVPSAGNAAGALAAYAAAAGIAAHIYMPQDVPLANYLEGIVYGADVHMVDGLISDCARLVAEQIKAQKAANTPTEQVWFDISTLKEPYRVEGKKTMGYELVEQLGWQYPDAVFYPTGGGVGLIGMWKAFDEMEQLGWVEKGSKRPKMYALQASGCAPIATAFDAHQPASEFFQNAATFAAGLRVPKPYGDTIILDILAKSGGKAIASSEEADPRQHSRLGQARGHLPLPRGSRRHRRLRHPDRHRRTQAHRPRRPLQHRRRPQVHRHDRRRHAPPPPRHPPHQQTRRRHHPPPITLRMPGAHISGARRAHPEHWVPTEPGAPSSTHSFIVRQAGVPGGRLCPLGWRVGYRAQRDRFLSHRPGNPSHYPPKTSSRPKRRTASPSAAQWRDPCICP